MASLHKKIALSKAAAAAIYELEQKKKKYAQKISKIDRKIKDLKEKR